MNTLLSRLVVLGAHLAVPAFALGLVLPGCFLDRSGVVTAPPPHRTYRITATAVRNLDSGMEFTFDYGNDDLDPAAGDTVDFESESTGDTSPETVAIVEAWFRRYVKQQLDARTMVMLSDGFRMTFGPGSNANNWCLLTAPTVTQTTTGELRGSFTPRPTISGDELRPCMDPPPAECENPPGVTPVLQFSPASPFSFGGVGVGLDSGLVPITLTNMGTGILCLRLRDLEGTHAPSFTLQAGDPNVAGTCVPQAIDPVETSVQRVRLDPGEPCTLNVSFHPTMPGPHMATVPVTSNDPTTPSLALLGSGLGGVLSLTRVDPPSALDGSNRACVAPDPVLPGRYGTFLDVENAGPGIVTIVSPPSETAWRINTITVGGVADADGTPPWVLNVGSRLRFRVRSADPAVEGTLSFAGNQQNNPLDIGLRPAATCP